MSNLLQNYFSKSHAVIIGINEYQNFPSLKNAVNDVKGIVDVLQDEAVHNYQIHGPYLNTGYADIKKLLEETLPAIVGMNDRILFYFAGHGVANDSDQEDQPKGYLLPSDAAYQSDELSISMDYLRVKLEGLKCRHLLLVLDCCFSGAFRWSSLEKRGIQTQKLAKKVYQERFDRFLNDGAWQVLTSSSYDEEALDGVYAKPLGSSRNHFQTKYSPFANLFIKALQGEADVVPADQPDGLITVSEMYVYIREEMDKLLKKANIKKQQRPGFFYLPKHDKGEYVFLSPKVILNLPNYDATRNPYKGLKSYELADSPIFFGRDRVIKELSEFSKNRKLVIVTGASGTGKSSLVKAGLLPLLKKEGHEVVTMRPGKTPLHSLELALQDKHHPSKESLLLVIDQLEEVITQCTDNKMQEAFQNELLSMLAKKDNNIKIILTIRSDFEPQFSKGILETEWNDNRFKVPAFTTEEYIEIIERPANQRLILFDPPELVEQIMEEVQNAPGALPLLSFTMNEMYQKLVERGDFRAFKLQDYKELGGVIGSLSNRADQLYESLDDAHQVTLQKIMLRMVSHEGGDLAKRRVLIEELTFVSPAENERVNVLLDKLLAARLIVRGEEDGHTFVEPAHDALVRAWGTLWGWKSLFGQERLLLINKLSQATQDYALTKNEEDLWYKNPRLVTVLENKDNFLNKSETTFVLKSKQVRIRKKRQTRMGIGAVIATILGFILFNFIQANNSNFDLSLAILDSYKNQGKYKEGLNELNGIQNRFQKLPFINDAKVDSLNIIKEEFDNLDHLVPDADNWMHQSQRSIIGQPNDTFLVHAYNNYTKALEIDSTYIRSRLADLDALAKIKFERHGVQAVQVSLSSCEIACEEYDILKKLMKINSLEKDINISNRLDSVELTLAKKCKSCN